MNKPSSRFVDDGERRARIGRRHLLAASCKAKTPDDVAGALTAIHGTDPGSTMLAILNRCPDASVPDVERAFFEERTIVRVLGMRRTLFAVDWELAPAVWVSSRPTVVREQLRILSRMLETTGISNPEPWILEAETRLLAFLESNPGSTSAAIAADDPYLGYRVPQQAGAGATQSVTSRLLMHMSADGRLVRARPKGGWTSTQFTWELTSSWRSNWPVVETMDDADRMIAASWLRGHGPATVDDLSWWAGWPKGRTRKAIELAGGVGVRTDAGDAFLLEDDLEPVGPAEPWVALLPGLDSTTMGWRHREFYLGPHAKRVFDNVGNGGPTVWVDGRIVGGWSQLDSGEVVFELFDDVGRDAVEAIEAKAADLTVLLEGVRLKPRARRYTTSEVTLLGRGA